MAKSKKPAKVTLDAGSVAKIESTLRGALVNASAANIVTIPKPAGAKKTVAVPLDTNTVAQFAEHLRSGLQSAAAANIGEDASSTKKAKPSR
jgi:hypothetical protein